MSVATIQFAVGAFERGASRSDQDALRAALSEASRVATKNLSSDKHIQFQRLLSIDTADSSEIVLYDADVKLKLCDRQLMIAWVAPPVDLACLPRRDGGSASFRIAMRASLNPEHSRKDFLGVAHTSETILATPPSRWLRQRAKQICFPCTAKASVAHGGHKKPQAPKTIDVFHSFFSSGRAQRALSSSSVRRGLTACGALCCGFPNCIGMRVLGVRG